MKTCRPHRRKGCPTCQARANTSDPYADPALWLPATADDALRSTDSGCDSAGGGYGSSSDTGSTCAGGESPS